MSGLPIHDAEIVPYEPRQSNDGPPLWFSIFMGVAGFIARIDERKNGTPVVPQPPGPSPVHPLVAELDARLTLCQELDRLVEKYKGTSVERLAHSKIMAMKNQILDSDENDEELP